MKGVKRRNTDLRAFLVVTCILIAYNDVNDIPSYCY